MMFSASAWLRAQVGYLPENGPLYGDMTALELLRFFGEARGLSAMSDCSNRMEAVIRAMQPGGHP